MIDLHARIVEFSQPKGVLHPAVVGFLVLSGYVIVTGFNNEKLINNRSYYVREWGIRRLFRIIPVYLLGVLIGAAVFVKLNGSNFRSLTGTNDVSSGCLVAKSFSISSFIPLGYPNCAFQGNAPLVTTSAEIGLYLIFILTSIYLAKGFHKSIVIAIAISWLVGNLLLATILESSSNLQ